MIDYQNPQYLQPILLFLEKINIPFTLETITGEMFLPGVIIKNGTLIIDTSQLQFPGDVLHEAGHLALAPAEIRSNLNNPIAAQLDFDAATHEIMTLAWSYAAAIESGTPLEVLFHPKGYKGQNESIIQGFQSGQYIGLPMLQWLGMSCDAQYAAINNVKPFPDMIQWLRPAQVNT